MSDNAFKTAMRPMKERKTFYGNFSACPNCFPGFGVDVLVKQVSRTEVKSISLPAGADSSISLIPEWLVDVPLGGAWKNSSPDLMELLHSFSISVSMIDVFGNIGYLGSERMLKSCADFAKRIGLDLMNVACAPELDGSKKNTAYSIIRGAASYASEQGVRIALETYGGITRNADECLKTLEAVDEKNVGICYDTANVLRFSPEIISGRQLAEDMGKLKGLLFAMHLKDYVRETKEIVALGQGMVDFPMLFDILAESHFNGVLELDLETSGAHTAEEHYQALAASLAYLHSIGVRSASA